MTHPGSDTDCQFLTTSIGRLTALGAGESGTVGDTFISYDLIHSKADWPWPVEMDHFCLLNTLTLALDASYVYYDIHPDCTTELHGQILKQPIYGGVPTTLAVNQNEPEWLTVDSSNIYWVNTNCGSGCSLPPGVSTINQIAKTGGTITTLATAQLTPGGIASDGSSVYWNDGDVSGSIVKTPVGGGSLTTLAAGLYGLNHSIVVTSGYVYVVDTAGILKIPASGGTPTTLATSNLPFDVAVDSTSVYWSDKSSPGHVYKTSISGGSVTTLAATSSGIYSDVNAVDSTYVYWSEYTTAGGSFVRIPIGGGTQTTIAAYDGEPISVAINSTDMYSMIDYDGISENGELNRTSLFGGAQPTGGSSVVNMASFADTSQASNSVSFTYSDAWANFFTSMTVFAAPVTGVQGTIDWTLKVAQKCN